MGLGGVITPSQRRYVVRGIRGEQGYGVRGSCNSM